MDKRTLTRRFRIALAVFIAGLVISGITAFPLESEIAAIIARLPHSDSALMRWLTLVYTALNATNCRYPFLAYGTDWLAFAHLTIAVAFIGPWLHPVRNRWLISFGIIACLGVVPLALIAGAIRGIPLGWRFIDISFGVFGVIPLLACRHYVAQLRSPGIKPPFCREAPVDWVEIVASFHL